MRGVIGGTCCKHVNVKLCKKFELENLYGSDNLEDVGADGM